MVSFKLVKEIEKDVLHLVASVGTKRVSFFGTVVEHRSAEFEGLRHLFLIISFVCITGCLTGWSSL